MSTSRHIERYSRQNDTIDDKIVYKNASKQQFFNCLFRSFKKSLVATTLCKVTLNKNLFNIERKREDI